MKRDMKEKMLKELIEAQKALKERVETQDQMIKRFETLTLYDDLFIQIIDFFPYPIAVFSPTGILEMGNNALLSQIGLGHGEIAVNKYNILNDSAAEESGIQDAVKSALAGQTVFLFDMKEPLNVLRTAYGIKRKCESSCQDVVLFPITKNGGQLSHVVCVVINQKA